MTRQHEIGLRYWELRAEGKRAKPLYERIRAEFGANITDSTIRAYATEARKGRQTQLFDEVFGESFKVEAMVGAAVYLKALKEAQARGLTIDDLLNRLLHIFCMQPSVIDGQQNDQKSV